MGQMWSLSENQEFGTSTMVIDSVISWDKDHQGRISLGTQACNWSLWCTGPSHWVFKLAIVHMGLEFRWKICVDREVVQGTSFGPQKVIVREGRLRRSGQWGRVKIRRLWCPRSHVKKVSWKKQWWTVPKVSKVKTGISPLGLPTWSSWPPESIGLGLVTLPQGGPPCPLSALLPSKHLVLSLLCNCHDTCVRHFLVQHLFPTVVWPLSGQGIGMLCVLCLMSI